MNFMNLVINCIKDLISLRKKINELKDLDENIVYIAEIEKKFTIFNAQIINEFIKNKWPKT